MRDDVAQGLGFYGQLQEAVKTLHQEVGDYCLARSASPNALALSRIMMTASSQDVLACNISIKDFPVSHVSIQLLPSMLAAAICEVLERKKCFFFILKIPVRSPEQRPGNSIPKHAGFASGSKLLLHFHASVIFMHHCSAMVNVVLFDMLLLLSCFMVDHRYTAATDRGSSGGRWLFGRGSPWSALPGPSSSSSQGTSYGLLRLKGPQLGRQCTSKPFLHTRSRMSKAQCIASCAKLQSRVNVARLSL